MIRLRSSRMAQVVSEVGDYFNNIAVFALVMEKSGSGLVVTGVMLARATTSGCIGPEPKYLEPHLAGVRSPPQPGRGTRERAGTAEGEQSSRSK